MAVGIQKGPSFLEPAVWVKEGAAYDSATGSPLYGVDEGFEPARVYHAVIVDECEVRRSRLGCSKVGCHRKTEVSPEWENISADNFALQFTSKLICWIVEHDHDFVVDFIDISGNGAEAVDKTWSVSQADCHDRNHRIFCAQETYCHGREC